MFRILLSITLIACSIYGYAQCPVILTSEFSFATDGVCAPVEVSGYTATYTLLGAQDPNAITIRFEWNDPAATVDDFTNGTGLVVSGGNTIFEATGTFTYDPGLECAFEPTVTLLFNGDICTSSTQDVFVWDDDDSFGGVMAINPNDYTVCFNSAITGAVFTDNSTFNCNPFDNDPGIANQVERFTQFVYGTNHPVNSIRDLTVDGNVVTDGNGDLATPETRGTAGELVTAGFFGDIIEVPFPAQEPNNVSLAIAAPSNALNLVGNTFEVTLFNWNTCNPYNGDPNDPNYEDAVRETVTITVVDPPIPGFQAHKNSLAGIVPSPAEFCLGETIYFEDTTLNAAGITYFWEFYDDNTDAGGSIGTSTNANPTFVYNSVVNPQKLIRLTVTNPNVPAACTKIYENFVTISDAPVAGIELRDTTDAIYITAPKFCQDGSSTFTVEFNDTTTGFDINTRWRWEFYDGSMNLTESLPAGLGNYSDTSISDFTRSFTQEELITVRLRALNQLTGCETTAETVFGIYSPPVVDFTADEACEGAETNFTMIADETGSLVPRINSDSVNSYQWDFSYDSLSFNVDTDLPNNDDFSSNLGPAGTYDVALVMTTAIGQCSDTLVKSLVVNPLPESSYSDTFISAICPGGSIDFLNTSMNDSLVVTYDFQISHDPSGSSFDLTGIDSLASFAFANPDDSIRTYSVFLEATTDKGCVTNSTSSTVLVNSDEDSGFEDPDFNFIDPNCSPYTGTLEVDANTIALDVDQYHWDILDPQMTSITGFPITKNNGDTDFHRLDYQVENDTTIIQNYTIVLEAVKAGVCISNDTFNIRVSPVPESGFTTEKTESCAQVVLTVEADNKGFIYDWNYSSTPDNLVNLGDIQIATFLRDLATGSDIPLDVTLTVTNLASCQSVSDSQSFTVERKNPDLVASFGLDNDTLRSPQNTVAITNFSTSGVNYLWDFGDSTTSSLEVIVDHTYTDPGFYNITLTVSDDYCEALFNDQFVLLPEMPIVDFSADTVQGCAPLTVNFINLSQFAESGEYLWQFGEGNFSLADTVSHTYLQPGTYSVTLSGKNALDEGDVEQKTAFITVFENPTSQFIVDKTDFCEDVDFTLEAVQDGLVYDWTIIPTPDGQTGNEGQLAINYLRPANSNSDLSIDITLDATSPDGCSSGAITQNFEVEKRNVDLVADFLISEDTLKEPFNTLQISNFSTQNVNYTWDFGDGTISSSASLVINHEYSQYGNYQIFLTVTDDYCQATAVKPFVLLPRDPEIDFGADVMIGCSPLTVSFTNLSEFAVDGNYQWDFGDGSISNADQPVHTYFEGGAYTIRLIGENVAGIRGEETKEAFIEIYGSPVADFSATPRIVYIPDQQVYFRNLSKNAVTFLWDFGDGSEQSTEMDPVHQYENEGFYDITLVVANELGCKDSLFRQTEIQAVIGGQVSSPNAFTPSLTGPTGGEIGSGGNGSIATVNDIFLPQLEGVIQFQMQIFNKWGHLLFESKSQTRGWDGYVDGKLAPAGVYIYKLELTYSDGRGEIKVGDLTLIR